MFVRVLCNKLFFTPAIFWKNKYRSYSLHVIVKGLMLANEGESDRPLSNSTVRVKVRDLYCSSPAMTAAKATAKRFISVAENS